ncbi:unnamed protein product [Ranitomeya imitator]|uniref:VWFD domain-containing protein n=1 Tax=Ranitomeya imitator TaxID=111125 RepID=A0ABN9MDM5_9NEOB|nr:unnamed protein product [Ranitomeya imitator]
MPATCSIDGGSHITTYDQSHYNIHGDCNYVLSKDCNGNSFIILTELRKCGLTDSETCLKSATLIINGGETVTGYHDSALLAGSSGMQSGISAPLVGLCGNFNDKQSDDFQTISGVIEGTAASFANTWKTQADCANNCMFDTCNCEKSEECLCASLSAYVHACAVKGIILTEWRSDVCTKYMNNCPKTLSYTYSTSTCQHTCRSLSEPDVTCSINFTPVDGCTCAKDFYMDDSGKCVPAEACPCYFKGSAVPSGEVVHDNGVMCTCNLGKLACIGAVEPTCTAPMVYFDCKNASVGTKGAECQKSCQTLDMACDHCGKDGSSNSFRVITENIPCGSTGTTCSKSIKVFLGGKVCGLCGNYDGDGNNDFTTRSLSVVGDVTEFGNSWKMSQTCPDANVPRDACSANPYRKSWSQKQCSIINSKAFSACHAQIDPSKYYDACVTDSCACDSGGDCECFCTAVAAYAQACGEFGICVSWRSPNICPLFCDYYNPEGECEWHYKPCGAPCMKTCRNPTGRCVHDLSGLEGCYPSCPAEKPFFNEEEMKCVSQCDCYDDEEKHYKVGEDVPTTENCKTCKCSMSGLVECKYQKEGTTPVSTICVKEVCKWSEWIDASYPKDGERNGDFDTYENIRKKGISICSHPQDIQCRAERFPDTPLAELEQVVQCNVSFGLICRNDQQLPPICYNYEIRVMCCNFEKWTNWIDVNIPTSGIDGGEKETLEDIIAKDKNICRNPKYIECRAEDYPGISIDNIGQKVQCDITVGLVCNNKDQIGEDKQCYNYQTTYYHYYYYNYSSATNYNRNHNYYNHHTYYNNTNYYHYYYNYSSAFNYNHYHSYYYNTKYYHYYYYSATNYNRNHNYNHYYTYYYNYSSANNYKRNHNYHHHHHHTYYFNTNYYHYYFYNSINRLPSTMQVD